MGRTEVIQKPTRHRTGQADMSALRFLVAVALLLLLVLPGSVLVANGAQDARVPSASPIQYPTSDEGPSAGSPPKVAHAPSSLVAVASAPPTPELPSLSRSLAPLTIAGLTSAAQSLLPPSQGGPPLQSAPPRPGSSRNPAESGGTPTNLAMHPDSAPTQEAWAQVCASCSPSARYGEMMAYDPGDGYVVLYGGQSTGGSFQSDTWTYSAGTWTQDSTTIFPPARSAGAFAWDAADSEMILFGGANYYGTQDSDTWAFSGGHWTQLSPSNVPQARYASGMAYDAADGYLVMYGGYTTQAGGAYGSGIFEFGDLWEFKSGNWKHLPVQGTFGTPSNLSDPNMAYDAYDGYVVMFGGRENHPPAYAPYTWEYNGGNWYNLSSSVAPPTWNCGSIICSYQMAFDTKDRKVVYETPTSGGSEQTWLFQSGTWSQDTAATPPNGWDGGMDYDAADSYVLYFGGTNIGGNQGWIFPGILSASISPNQPGVDQGQTLTLTADVQGGAPGYSYLWTQLPSGCNPANQNAITCQPNAQGTWQTTVQVTDSGGRVVTSSALSMTVSAPPTVSTPAGSEPFSDVNEQVSFTTSVSGGPGTYLVYNWDQLPTGCPSANSSSLACTPTSVGSYFVQVTATDGNHDTKQSSAISYQVLSNPSVSLAENHSVIDIGESLKFWANASGGTGTYTYTFNNLPSGCISANVSILTCRPQLSATGVTVTVVDTVGGTATSGPVAFTVDSDPTVVTGFTRGSVSAYVSEYLQVQITYGGGTPNYRPCLDAPGSVTGGWVCGAWQGGSSYTFGFWYTTIGSYTITTSLEDSTGWNVTYSFTETIYASLSSGGVSLPSVTDQGMTVTGQTTIQNGIPGFILWWNDTSSSNVLCTVGQATDGPVSCSFVVGWTGTHNVQLTVRDAGWDSYFANLTLGANPALHGLGLNASAGAFTASQGGTLQDEVTASTLFTGAYQGGTSPVTVTWSFNGSVTMGTGTTLSYSWAHSAIYAVKESVQDSLGDLISGTILVQVNPPASGLALSSHLASLDTGIGDNLTANFTGGLAPFTFSWNFGDGSQASGGHPWTAHAWTAAGTYTITVTLKDAAGVQSSTFTQVLVLPSPSVGGFSASSASATVHAGGTLATYENATVQFSGEVQGGSSPYTFTWSSNGTVLGTVQSAGPWYNLTFTWRTTGTFDITFTLTDKQGQSSSAGAQVIISQDGIGLASISAVRTTVDAGVADNLTVNFQGGLAPYTFGWILGDGSGTRTAEPWIVHTWTGAGSYLISVDIQDSLGATLTITTTLTVNPALSVACSPMANASVIWAGDPASISLACAKNGTTPYSFDWSFGDGNAVHGGGSQVPYTWATPGNYSVRAIANDSGGGSVESGTLRVQVVAFTQTIPIIQSGTYEVLSTSPSSSWKTARVSVTLTTFNPCGTVVSWRMAPAGSSISSASWRAWGTILLTLNVSQANATRLLVFEVSNSLGRVSTPYSLTLNLTSLVVSNPGGPGSNGSPGMDLGAEVLIAVVVTVAAVMSVLTAWALSQRKGRQLSMQKRGTGDPTVHAVAGGDPVTVALLAHLKDHPAEEEEAAVSLVHAKTGAAPEDVRIKLHALAESGVVSKEAGSGATRYSLSEKGGAALAAMKTSAVKQATDEHERDAVIEARVLETIDRYGEATTSQEVDALAEIGVPAKDVLSILAMLREARKIAVKPGGKTGEEPVFVRPSASDRSTRVIAPSSPKLYVNPNGGVAMPKEMMGLGEASDPDEAPSAMGATAGQGPDLSRS